MNIPLAERLRPKKIEDIVGQDHLLGEGCFLNNVMESGKVLSILLWGPPGCGKTSLARLYAQAFDMRFVSLSAAANSLADVKKVIKDTQEMPLIHRGTVLFLDEIHRFNKAQQDALLPPVEKGTIVLVGATTENPSFYLNDALLSRMRVLTLKGLDTAALKILLRRCEEQTTPLALEAEARDKLLELAGGDGRYLLNMVENLLSTKHEGCVTVEDLCQLVQRRAALFDKSNDGHYNLISALHKSVRGSDPDAALYWFARMLEGGEEPLFIARRLIRMATEDVGLADPQALPIAIAARDSFQMLGSPEGELALAQCVVYLALAPKSNAIYTAYSQARELAAKTNQYSPPMTILNAPTRLMKDLGYGKDYIYDHDTSEGCSGQKYFPQEVARQDFYHPIERGFEREMRKRLLYFKKFRETQQN